jgi:hypothetical protein
MTKYEKKESINEIPRKDRDIGRKILLLGRIIFKNFDESISISRLAVCD